MLVKQRAFRLMWSVKVFIHSQFSDITLCYWLTVFNVIWITDVQYTWINGWSVLIWQYQTDTNAAMHCPYQCLKRSGHLPNFTIFTITVRTILHTFPDKIVLKIFQISSHVSEKSDNGLWPGVNKNTEQCIHGLIVMLILVTHSVLFPSTLHFRQTIMQS